MEGLELLFVKRRCKILWPLALLCVQCYSFQFQGHGFCDSRSAGVLKCRVRIGTSSRTLHPRDAPVCFKKARSGLVLPNQNPSKRSTLLCDASNPSNPTETLTGTVGAVAAEDSSRFCQLLVDVFEPPTTQGMDVIREWVRNAWWLNLYLGVVQRIFIASFVRGMREASADSQQQADVHTSPDEFHAMFGIKDDKGNFCGAVELNCMPCPIPSSRQGGAEPPVPYVSNLAVREDCRGMGLATAMIKRCEEEARAWGSDEIFLSTTVDNEKALLLYRRLGYVTEMLEPLATKRPKVYMRKLLPSDPLAPPPPPCSKPQAAPLLPDALSVCGAESSERRLLFSQHQMYQPVPHPLLQYAGPLAPILVSSWAVIAFLLF